MNVGQSRSDERLGKFKLTICKQKPLLYKMSKSFFGNFIPMVRQASGYGEPMVKL